MNCVKGTSSKFAKNVTACLLVDNLTALIRIVLGEYIMDPLKDRNGGALVGFWPSFAGVCDALLMTIELTAFNLGNWYFAFHYFKCSSELKFLTQ